MSNFIPDKVFSGEFFFHLLRQISFLHRIVPGDVNPLGTSQVQKVMGFAQPAINILGKAQYLWHQAYVLYLVGPLQRDLLRAAQTE